MIRLGGKYTAHFVAAVLFLWLVPSFYYFHGSSEELPSGLALDLKPIGSPPSPSSDDPETEATFALPLSREDTRVALEPLLQPRSESQLDQDIAGHNRRTLEGVTACAFGGLCVGYQSKGLSVPSFPLSVDLSPHLTNIYFLHTRAVIILDGQHFPSALHPDPSRDNYFESSAITSLRDLHVSYVFSQHNASWAVSLHTILGSLVHGVIFQEGDHRYDLKACFADDSESVDSESGNVTPGCVQGPKNPHGLPAHKVFGWSNDMFPGSPLGRAWTLVSEPFEQGQTFIGFSVQSACESGVLPFVDSAKRQRKPARAWIHANLETYFWPNHNVWPPSFFDRVMEELGVEPTAALEPGYARLKEYPKTEGVYAVPRVLKELDRSRMGREEILAEMAQSVLFVALGDPKE